MGIAPSVLRGRILTTTYLYEDPDHPGRPTRSHVSPAWTADDRSLMVALELYESTLCAGCGEPRAIAWHAETEGEYEAHRFVCNACEAKVGTHQATFNVLARRPAPEVVAKYLPFDLLETTREAPPEEGER